MRVKLKSFLLLLFILVLGWRFFHFQESPDSKDPRKTLAPSGLAPITLAAPSPLGQPLEATKPLAAAASPGSLVRAESHGPQAESHARESVTTQDLNGREIDVDAPSITRAQATLRQRAAIDPEKKFDSLAVPDFEDQQTAMFMGTFEDSATHVQLQLFFDRGTPKLSLASCVVTQESGPVSGAGGELQFKDDRTGYAGVMIKNRWYLKLAYSFDPHRKLNGKLYGRGERGWVFLHDFSALETHVRLKCP
jgi:hypothetical protein